jgi:hypothetical protein
MSIPTLTKYRTIYLEGGLEEYYKLGKESHHKALKSLGVLNNKHIPEVYLKKYKRCSQVLAGLIDTDGYLGEGGIRLLFCKQNALEDIPTFQITGFQVQRHPVSHEDLYKCTEDQNNVKLTDRIYRVVTI